MSFISPWVLSALVFLPFLWRLLRMVPPSPRRQSFPAIALLAGLTAERSSLQTTPLWLALLRLILAALIIVGAAHPVIDAPAGSTPTGPLLIAVDNGWAAARYWSQRLDALDRLLDEADRASRPVILLPTAAPADGSPIAAFGPRPAAAVKAVADALRPMPWSTDRAAAAKALDFVADQAPMRIIWLSDGLGDAATAGFAKRLAGLGAVEMVREADQATAKLLVPPRQAGADLTVKVRRAWAGGAETLAIDALDGAGRGLARQTLVMETGITEADLTFPLPSELRNRVSRFVLEDEATAGAVVLLDERWRRHPVGLVEDAGGGHASPLLDDLFYSERALAPMAEVRRGSLGDLLARDLSLVVLADVGNLPEDAVARLSAWVERGGVLLRIAGPNLAKGGDSLLPVRLRGGGRTFGGAMSWTEPMRLAPMPDAGPFRGVGIPDDLKVGTQVLAEPDVDLDGKTWARLADGTPMVTGAPRGKGWLVLIHTSVGPAWSNLGLSGLYPEMLRRLIALSQGVEGTLPGHALAPAQVLDGFGQLGTPSAAVEALHPDAPATSPGPRHPPGYYGDETARVSVNLGADSPPLRPVGDYPGVRGRLIGDVEAALDLETPLLTSAVILLLADLLLILFWRGDLSARKGAAALVILVSGLAAAFGPTPARAAPPGELQAALQPRLAYVLTGQAAIDEISRAGLLGLSQLLERRTTASLGEPMGVDPARDSILLFPLLYWPVTAGQGPLSSSAKERLNAYMHHGGMILFDSRDLGDGSSGTLRGLLQGLDIPPLTMLDENHVLTRSYYLLREWPGRLAGAPLFVEDGGDPANDNVSPVVIGGNDWAGAWAMDGHGNPLLPVIPGGEPQRELAFRFGVNLVMYALTGSYKADQVHLPAIMERLKR